MATAVAKVDNGLARTNGAPRDVEGVAEYSEPRLRQSKRETKKPSRLERFFNPHVPDARDATFEKELSKIVHLGRTTRKRIFLLKQTFTRTKASVEVENAYSPRPQVTVRATVQKAEIWHTYSRYDQEHVPDHLRRLLPPEPDFEELSRPIGDLADDMDEADLSWVMRRAAELDASRKRSRADGLRRTLQKRAHLASQREKPAEPLDHDSTASERLSHSPYPNRGKNNAGENVPIVSEGDDPSQLDYYRRRGVLTRAQASKVLQQQRIKLNKERQKTKMAAQAWASNEVSDSGSQSYANNRDGSPRDVRRKQNLKDGTELARPMRLPSGGKATSKVQKRASTIPTRTNAFFRNREKSAIMAKFTSISLEVVLSGEAAKAVIQSEIIGAIDLNTGRKKVTTESTTENEEVVEVDPDDPFLPRDHGPAYHYEPLTDERHFRLLSVNPLTTNGRFAYKMQTFNINEAPPFESVSYVWGQDQRDYRISFDDSSMLRITPSLFSALPVLSQHCQTGYLWIDQLCIDQSNVNERNHSVKQMGDIYRKAQKVLVFLDCATRVFWPEGLFTLLEFIQNSFSTGSSTSLSLLHSSLAEVIQPHYSDGSNEAAIWRDLVRLFQHPWFTRAWIFQELVLSDIVLFAMGKKLAPLDAMLRLANCAASFEKESLPVFIPNQCLTRSPGLQQLQMMAHVREQRMLKGDIDPDRFWDIFSQVAPNCQLSEERDRLFAFLGLLSDSRINIQPDYRNSVKDVFVHASAAVINGQRSLDWLAYVDRERTSRLGLPSWVPDWTVSQHVELFNRKVFAAAVGRPHNTMTNRISLTANIDGIFASGKIIDHIVYVSPSPFYSSRPWESRDIGSFLNLDEHVDRILRKLGNFMGRPIGLLTRLMRVVLADGVEASTVSRGIGYTPMRIAKLRSLVQVYQRACRIATLRAASRDGHATNALLDVSKLRELLRLSRVAFGRRIFVTKNYRLGLGPERIAVGDHVCILHGSSLPVVLTKNYRVKGQCYFEGAMQGEDVKWAIEDADEFWIT